MIRKNASKLLLVAALLSSALMGADTAEAAGGAVIVDLSQDLEDSSTISDASPGAVAVREAALSDEFIRTALVLEDGKVVASYVRDGIDPDEPFQCWSTTKSWTSLLTGLAVQDSSLKLTETLGEIFPDEGFWANATDVEFRKAVTIQEMLTMSSGLISPPNYFDPEYLPDAFDLRTAGGSTLEDSLAYPLIGEKGEFSYLGISNIMSYVILERTGKTPRQYLADKVLPDLGIDDSDINWWRNADMVEYAYHGIELTAKQMAKFGLLYLQGGRSGPDRQLISPDWIDESLTRHLSFTVEIVPGLPFSASYGYLFWSAMTGSNDTNWCALGAFGQDICISAELGRVSVQQRDNEGDGLSGGMTIMSVALNPDLSFQAEGEAGGTSANNGGAENTGSSKEEDSSGIFHVEQHIGRLSAAVLIGLLMLLL